MIKTLNTALHQQSGFCGDINFKESNLGIRLAYNQIDAAVADICFSTIMITHSVLWYCKTFSDSESIFGP